MKINQIIINEMTSGCVATVSKPLGEIQKRPDVSGLKPVGSKTKKKGPYANSLLEGKVKELKMDLSSGNDGLSDAEFKKKYGKSKEEMRKSLKEKPKTDKPVQEAKLDEDDLILIPGQKIKRKTGLVPHGQSRVDHEVEMARSDVLATMKNAKAIYELLKNRSEEEGIEGWVQEKLIKANDYLNAVKEYYDEKMMQQEMTGGVIAAGGVGENVAENQVTEEEHDYYRDYKAGLISHDEYQRLVNRFQDTKKHNYKATDNGPFYLKINGKILRTGGEIKVFDYKKSATNYALAILKKKPELLGKIFITKSSKDSEQNVAEGAKVDRMVQHIKKSEIKAGKSADKAEDIAWATVNKRGYLDNKNKKKD